MHKYITLKTTCTKIKQNLMPLYFIKQKQYYHHDIFDIIRKNTHFLLALYLRITNTIHIVFN